MDIPLPLTQAVGGMLADLIEDGKGDLDHSAIVQWLEAVTATEIASPQAAPSYL